jgi:hypothetical protein
VSLKSLLSSPLPLTVDREAAAGGEHARRTGRSWWALQYIDGTVIHEWDLDRGSPNGHADWPRLAMIGKLKGVRALRLYCPSGKMVELGGEGDQTGKLLQFKLAARNLGVGATVLGQEVLAHVVGIVTGFDGQCVLYAWEPQPEPQRPDPADFAQRPPGSLGDAYATWRRQHDAWRSTAGGHLVGPISDNVYDLHYQQIGRLNADHLGLADGEGR